MQHGRFLRTARATIADHALYRRSDLATCSPVPVCARHPTWRGRWPQPTVCWLRARRGDEVSGLIEAAAQTVDCMSAYGHEMLQVAVTPPPSARRSAASWRASVAHASPAAGLQRCPGGVECRRLRHQPVDEIGARVRVLPDDAGPTARRRARNRHRDDRPSLCGGHAVMRGALSVGSTGQLHCSTLYRPGAPLLSVEVPRMI
jgi:hypothetical protein